MKCKKILLAIAVLFIMSGCSVKYEVEITKDFKVKDKIELTEKNSKFITAGTTNKLYISTMAGIYQENPRYSSYKIEEEYNESESGIIAVSEYKSLQDYQMNNGVKKTLFGFIVFKEEKNSVTFTATDYRGDHFFQENDRGEIGYDRVQVDIKLPFEVIDENADKYDKEKGIYTWIFDKTNTDKEIKLVFNKKISTKKQALDLLKHYWYLLTIIPIMGLIVLLIAIKHKRVNRI